MSTAPAHDPDLAGGAGQNEPEVQDDAKTRILPRPTNQRTFRGNSAAGRILRGLAPPPGNGLRRDTAPSTRASANRILPRVVGRVHRSGTAGSSRRPLQRCGLPRSRTRHNQFINKQRGVCAHRSEVDRCAWVRSLLLPSCLPGFSPTEPTSNARSRIRATGRLLGTDQPVPSVRVPQLSLSALASS